MTTPAEYRALAARVMACAKNEEVPWWDVFDAFHPRPAPDAPLSTYDDWVNVKARFNQLIQVGAYLDAAAALFAPLRERGWRISVDDMTTDLGPNWYASATIPSDPADPFTDVQECPDECAARVALALLCRAAEGEVGQ